MNSLNSALGWSAVDKWGSRVVSLTVLLILGRKVGPEAFGVIAICTAFVALANVFVDAGFGRALIQKREINDSHIATSFWICVAIGSLQAAFTVIAAPEAERVFDAPNLAPALMVISTAMVFNSLTVTRAALLERDQNFRALSIRRVTATLCGGTVAVAMAFAGAGVWSLVGQVVVTAVVGTVAIWVIGGSHPLKGASVKSFRDLRAMGFGVVGVQLVGWANLQSDRIVVGLVLPIETLGTYFLAISLIVVLTELFGTVFSDVSLSFLAPLQNDLEKFRQTFYRFVSLVAQLAFPLFAMAGIGSFGLTRPLLGEDWIAVPGIFAPLCLLGAVTSVQYFDRSSLFAVGKAWQAFNLTLAQAVLGVVLLVALGGLGLPGIVAAVLLRQIAFWPVRLWVLNRGFNLNVRDYLSALAAPAIGSALLGSAIWLLIQNVNFASEPTLSLGGVAAFLSLYAAFMWSTNKREIGELLRDFGPLR